MKRKTPKVESSKREKVIKTEAPKITSKDERENFKKSLYKPPTSEELSQLKETESLYKNSLFRMQVSYLLGEVKVSDKKAEVINEFLHSVHSFLLGLPSTERHDVSDKSWLPKRTRFPLSGLMKSNVKGKFHFEKPSNIKVIGSHLLKTVTKPKLNVDIAVEIPKECFQAKDHLNFRYHTKRALYLTVLASHFKGWEQVSDIYFSRINNNPYKPILVLKPTGKAGKRYVVRIYPSIPEGLFKLSRFGPNRNNVRESWYNEQEEEVKDTEASGNPTPYYNYSILTDMLFEKHLRVLHNALSECPEMSDAISLSKGWLYQREFDKGSSCFNGFMVSMLMTYLLSNRKLSAHMSSYQILRVTLQYLATTDWTTKGISMVPDNEVSNTPSVEEFHDVFDVVFIDPSGYLNLCADMRKITFDQIRHEAKLSIEFLEDKHVDGFDVLFCKPVRFTSVFDHWFRINDFSALKEKTFTKELKSKIMDRGGDFVPICVDWIVPLLQRGLASRIKMLAFKGNETQQWAVKKKPPTSSISEIVFGLILDTDHSGVILDMGPPADDAEAVGFRKFWGEKSELRRFKDGSINEAVVWSGNNAAEKRMICRQVIEYLLNRHCGIPSSSISYTGDQLDGLLQPKYIPPDKDDQVKSRKNDGPCPGTGEEELHSVIRIFDELCKEIRRLDGLPLQVNSIQGVSPVFRLTEVMPPRPCNLRKSVKSDVEKNTHAFDVPSAEKKCPSWYPVAEAVLQFEVSGKWPDDLDAIKHIKTAFHIKLAEELQEQCHLIALPTPTHVDILKNGFLFRIRVFHYREMVLFEQSKAEGELKKEHELQAKLLDTNMIKLPLHCSYIHGLHQHFSAYAQTSRLAKRWVSSQMLGDYFSEEAIELITASLFMTPAPYRPARSHVNGFLRFLNLLANFDWQNEPLIVDFNNSLSDEDYHAIKKKFTSSRSQLPCIFIATAYDKEKSIWTKDQPNTQILRRLKQVAVASKQILEEELQNANSEESIKQIFRPPLDDFDVLIELGRDQVPRHYQAVDSSVRIKPPSGKIVKPQSMPVVNFDPVQLYLTELRDAFSDAATFFYDKFGGTIIGVVWKPQAFEPTPFKILKMQYKKLLVAASSKKGDATSEVLMVPNTDAILEDFKILGRGLVTNVKVNRTVDCDT